MGRSTGRDGADRGRCPLSPPVFLVPADALASCRAAQCSPARLTLDGPEGRHAATVRRIGPGELVHVTDGAGDGAECVVVSVGRDELELEVARFLADRPAEPRLVVVQALIKGERGEQAVELLTEVGVDVIVPWSAERSVVRWEGERGAKSLRRWRSTAVAAAKQSRRLRWPEVTDAATTADVSALVRGAALSAVLHEAAPRSLAAVDVPTSGDVVLIVGPEGGLSDIEVKRFSDEGAAAYRLGPGVLRASSAGSVAATLLLAQSRRWTI